MSTKKSAWCKQCDKLADGWDDMLVKGGWRRTVRCHGESYRRTVSHKQMAHRASQWFMEGLFQDTPIEFRPRRKASQAEGGG